MNLPNAVLVCFTAANHSDDLHKRIVNGEAVTSRAYPYQASLQIYQYEEWHHICGASIIGDNKLLTAAHCFGEEDDDEDDYAVLLGTLNLDDVDKSAQFIRVRSFKRHPGFKVNLSLGYPDDIAIVLLDSLIEFNDHVQVILNLPFVI
ncbi:unnamed protein product [Lymnaea stagnalis]|uniref:Peptidase S1 domain-containing protein n=1 Tax=Lymnaea stagnalis TaxID=6523 RepID=A0AAV2HFT3_LYMST